MGFRVVSVFGNSLFSLGPVSAGGGIGSIQSLQSDEIDYSFSCQPRSTNKQQTNNPGKQNKLNQWHSYPTPVSFWRRKIDFNKRRWANSEILFLERWMGLPLLLGHLQTQKWLRTEATRHAMLPFWKSSSTWKTYLKGHHQGTCCMTHAIPSCVAAHCILFANNNPANQAIRLWAHSRDSPEYDSSLPPELLLRTAPISNFKLSLAGPNQLL